MQGIMSESLCEAPRTMQIRGKRRMPPRGSANLWSDMVTLRYCEEKPVLETSTDRSISKRRYGVQAEGSPIRIKDGTKS